MAAAKLPPLYFIQRPPSEYKERWDWVGAYEKFEEVQRVLPLGNPPGSVIVRTVPLAVIEQFQAALEDLRDLRTTYATEGKKTPFWLAGRIESMLAAKKAGGL